MNPAKFYFPTTCRIQKGERESSRRKIVTPQPFMMRNTRIHVSYVHALACALLGKVPFFRPRSQPSPQREYVSASTQWPAFVVVPFSYSGSSLREFGYFSTTHKFTHMSSHPILARRNNFDKNNLSPLNFQTAGSCKGKTTCTMMMMLLYMLLLIHPGNSISSLNVYRMCCMYLP